MSVVYHKLNFILSAVLWSILLFATFTRAQNDPCKIYGDGFVCANDTRILQNVPFEDSLTCEQNLYEYVMKLLDDGAKILEEEFALTGSDEAVMMIGNTGTGKSTLTYFLAGDNSKMFAYQLETEVFGIKDCNGKIGSGDSTIVSATIFPDLVIENSTGTPFYDNPGFQDTRSACVEIANAYFMQQIANHVKKVKFVIVVNKFDVSPGGSREDFPRALRNVFNFVPNIEKFGSALALVATKLNAVDSNDDPFVKDVVSFMNQSKSSFPQIFDNEEELRKASFIVDSIANVSRVGVFRMPSECGPLSEMEIMQANRRNIINVISENMQYVESNPSDFSLTIGADAQLKVREIGIELAGKIKNSIQTFSSAIFNYFLVHFGCIEHNNCDDLVNDLKILLSNPDFIKEYEQGDFVGLNFIQIVKRITNTSFIPPKAFDSLPAGLIDDLVQSAGQLDFMNNLATLNIDLNSWLQSLKDTKRALKEQVGGLVSYVDQAVVTVLKELNEDFQGVFKGNLKKLVDGKLGDSSSFEAAIVGLYKSSYNLSQNVEGLEPPRYLSEIYENINVFKNGFSSDEYLNSQLSILSEWSFNLDFLTKSFNSSFDVHPKSWVVPLTALKIDVFEQIRLEIQSVTSNIGYFLGELFGIFEDHYSQLRANTEESFHQILDISQRQFDLLQVFSKSVVVAQLRKDFIVNLRNVVDSVNAVFIILGTQGFVIDIIRLDSALILLERLNTDQLAAIPAEWILNLQASIRMIRQHIDNFENSFINSF